MKIVTNQRDYSRKQGHACGTDKKRAGNSKKIAQFNL